MSNLQAELFIRKQIQKILLEKEETNQAEPAPAPEPKPTETQTSGGRVFGSVGRGRLPKEIAEVFAGEDGSAAELKRLASTNPAKLMKNLKVSRGAGNTTLERAISLITKAQQSTEAFKQAIGPVEEIESNSKRKGAYFPNAGLPSNRLVNLFIFDTLRGAAAVGYVKMTGHLRVEEFRSGVLVYNVKNEGDRWQ